MLSSLVIAYLFLGGVGAGVISVCTLSDVFHLRQCFGIVGYNHLPSPKSIYRTLDYGFLSGFIALVIGILCLLFDIGRLDRALYLFFYPSGNVLSLGSYALVILCLLVAFLVAVRFLYFPAIKRSLVVAAEVIAALIAMFVIVYTGILLNITAGVGIWSSPFIPVLFFLSSASSGIAIFMGISLFMGTFSFSKRFLNKLAAIDVVIIILEIICMLLFVYFARQSSNPGVATSYGLLMEGNLAFLWWMGFGLCGLAIPLVIELINSIQRINVAGIVNVAVVLVLIGTLCLRYTIVEVGVHRDLELEPLMESVLE